MTICTLYLCYFGLREPLVQTQVLPYLEQLASADINVELLTFEPHLREQWTEEELNEQRERLSAMGINWSYLPYHKTPSSLATAYDILAGAHFAVRLARSKRLDVLHARAHVPMAMALLARRFSRVKLIFDVRGLMAEEYRDAGIWTEGSLPFRFVKRLERIGLRSADQVVVLTERFRECLNRNKLKPLDQTEVIPCCVDLARFDSTTSASNEHRGHFEVVYAGSLTGLYLVDEMVQFFKVIKALRPEAVLRLFSSTPPKEIMAKLAFASVDHNDFEIGSFPPESVGIHLRGARLGLSFRKSAFAQIAASPTKIPEYLAAGVPVVCNAGIGDMDDLVEGERVGVVVREFSERAYQCAAAQALVLAEDPEISARCMHVARAHFDLKTIGAQRYINVYRKLGATLR